MVWCLIKFLASCLCSAEVFIRLPGTTLGAFPMRFRPSPKLLVHMNGLQFFSPWNELPCLCESWVSSGKHANQESVLLQALHALWTKSMVGSPQMLVPPRTGLRCPAGFYADWPCNSNANAFPACFFLAVLWFLLGLLATAAPSLSSRLDADVFNQHFFWL